MPYRVELAPAAARELRRLPRQIQQRIEPVILALGHTPRPTGVRKLRSEAQTYRIRIGYYRVIYDVYDNQQLVVVLHVYRRSESTYRAR